MLEAHFMVPRYLIIKNTEYLFSPYSNKYFDPPRLEIFIFKVLKMFQKRSENNSTKQYYQSNIQGIVRRPKSNKCVFEVYFCLLG